MSSPEGDAPSALVLCLASSAPWLLFAGLALANRRAVDLSVIMICLQKLTAGLATAILATSLVPALNSRRVADTAGVVALTAGFAAGLLVAWVVGSMAEADAGAATADRDFGVQGMSGSSGSRRASATSLGRTGTRSRLSRAQSAMAMLVAYDSRGESLLGSGATDDDSPRRHEFDRESSTGGRVGFGVPIGLLQNADEGSFGGAHSRLGDMTIAKPRALGFPRVLFAAVAVESAVAGSIVAVSGAVGAYTRVVTAVVVGSWLAFAGLTFCISILPHSRSAARVALVLLVPPVLAVGCGSLVSAVAVPGLSANPTSLLGVQSAIAAYLLYLVCNDLLSGSAYHSGGLRGAGARRASLLLYWGFLGVLVSQRAFGSGDV